MRQEKAESTEYRVEITECRVQKRDQRVEEGGGRKGREKCTDPSTGLSWNF